jgi:hypothetical protein
MNDLPLSAEERDSIAQATTVFFSHLEMVFQALYPLKSESKTILATTINPEAGRHAVPADPAELQAALRAGERCWRRFPYFEQRFGERGLRFTKSDGAWLGTLFRSEPEQILQQVRWLGRLLAARGMPTLLLQVKLEMLVEELSAATPAKQAEYQKLLPASTALLEARRKHLSDVQVEHIATAFDAAVGPEWTAKLPHTGALLACAVADDAGEFEGAVKSLKPWLTDPARFPAAWIAAVESALAKSGCR